MAVELVPHPMEALLGVSVAKFLNQVLTELAELGLRSEVVGREIDHICYRVSRQGEYEKLRADLLSANWATLLVEAAVGGRLISTFRLSPPLMVTGMGGKWDVTCLELPAPKPGRAYASGLEHIEVVVGTPEDGCVHNRAMLEAWVATQNTATRAVIQTTDSIDKKLNADVAVVLPFSKCVVKFHSRPLHEVIAFEATASHASALDSQRL